MAAEPSTEQQRATERHRRILWSSVATAGSKGLVILTTLIIDPLAIHYLGSERYGMWMTMSSIIGVFAFADLGLGSGLMTTLSHAHGRGDGARARHLVSTAFWMLVTVAAGLAVAVAVVIPLVPWARVFNVESPLAIREAGVATAVFAGCNIALLPFSVAEDVRAGFQETFKHALWLAVGAVLSLGGALIVIHFRGGLPWLVLAVAGGPLLGTAFSFAALFAVERPWLRPSRAQVSSEGRRELLSFGALFVVLEIAVLLSQKSDNVILAQITGADSVTRYSVANRLFTIAPFGLAFVLNQLWPAYGEAMARGDHGWVRRTLLRSLGISVVVTGIASALLVVLARPIVTVWIGPTVLPAIPLLYPLAIWSTLQAAGHAVAMLMNAAGMIRFQMVTAAVTSCTAIALKILLTRAWGPPGVVWATIVAYVPLTAIPVALYLPARLRSMRREQRVGALSQT